MATILQLRRGTTVQHSSFTGAVGEVTVDTTKDTVVVHDGTTAGGFPLAKESAIADFITLTDLSVTDSGGDGSLSYNNTTGVITYTGPSSSDYRGAISVTDSGGDGSLSYNSGTGVITYTGPSASDVRAHFSAGTGITITSGAIAVDTSTIATQSYVTTAINNVIDGAPAALDTLNELAAAINDDSSYASTISTALGNRLRVDVNNQGLTATQQGYALTNLGITATTTEINYIDGVTSAIQTQLDSKLASSSYTASDVLDKLKTVDGSGSGLDADLLDGQSSAYFRINVYDAAGTLLN